MARRAGIRQASSATKIKTTGAPVIVTGSYGDTPTNCDCKMRFTGERRRQAKRSRPIATGNMPSRRTIFADVPQPPRRSPCARRFLSCAGSPNARSRHRARQPPEAAPSQQRWAPPPRTSPSRYARDPCGRDRNPKLAFRVVNFLRITSGSSFCISARTACATCSGGTPVRSRKFTPSTVGACRKGK